MAAFSSAAAISAITYPPPIYVLTKEEEVGSLQLSNVAPVSGSQPFVQDYFINVDTESMLGATLPMNTIISDNSVGFSTMLANATIVTNFQTLANNYGTQIFNRAVALAQSLQPELADITSATDVLQPQLKGVDRILYWARIKMIVMLKRRLFQLGLSYLSAVDEFEKCSRGYYSANFTAGVKQILIAGYDPFQLVPGVSYNDPTHYNPSACFALYFHGKTLTSPQGANAQVFSFIIPNRYEFFDSSFAEDYFGRYITAGNNVNAIVSISLNGNSYSMDIERFYARCRGGYNDNLRENQEPPKAINPQGDATAQEFYETKLPVSTILQSPPGQDLDTRNSTVLVFDQSFEATDNSNPMVIQNNPLYNYFPESVTNPKVFGSGSNLTQNPFANSTMGLTPIGTSYISVEGSGGNYFSNELPYRIARLRDIYNNTAPSGAQVVSGHIHLPNTQITEFNIYKNNPNVQVNTPNPNPNSTGTFDARFWPYRPYRPVEAIFFSFSIIKDNLTEILSKMIDAI